MTHPRAPRSLTRLAAAAATFLFVLLVAGPAIAAAPGGGTGPGGGGTGCSGVTCYADVWQYIHLSGNAVGPAGSSGVSVPMPPPPCYMEPMFSGPELYALYKEGSGLPGDPEAPFAQYKQGIIQHKNDTGGYWWERITNLGVGGTCGLRLLAWVVNGDPPPLPQVPAIDLADYAYDHMRLPDPALTFNPAARSYVSLPTYVWATLPWNPPVGTVTATLGAESATVTATPGKLTLTATGGARVYQAGCTTLGSTAPDPPPNAGPGTTPNCGVTFTAPGTGNMITGKLVWTAISAGHIFPPIDTATSRAVVVDEIESLNS